MRRDLAAFDFETLHRIWGLPRSVLSGLRDTQWHHIEGRGGKYLRKMHSSPFNAIPLTDDEHDYGAVNQVELKEFFHRKALETVFRAYSLGYYEVTEIDRQYLRYYQLWTEEKK